MSASRGSDQHKKYASTVKDTIKSNNMNASLRSIKFNAVQAKPAICDFSNQTWNNDLSLDKELYKNPISLDPKTETPKSQTKYLNKFKIHP